MMGTLKPYHILIPKYLLPAATKLGQGNKFTGVCLSTGGVVVWSRGGLQFFGGSPIFRGWSPIFRGVSNFSGVVSNFLGVSNFLWGLQFFGGGLIQIFFPKNFFWDAPPPIRSLSGRYASYWNAFLFELIALQGRDGKTLGASISTPAQRLALALTSGTHDRVHDPPGKTFTT